jgi:hypothetical protein
MKYEKEIIRAAVFGSLHGHGGFWFYHSNIAGYCG